MPFASKSLPALALRFREAADYAAQRLKALELVACEGVPWAQAQYQELTTPDNRGLLSTPADWSVIMSETKSRNKLLPDPTSKGFWAKGGKGSYGRY